MSVQRKKEVIRFIDEEMESSDDEDNESIEKDFK